MTLAMWLRTGRAQRGMSLQDVAKVTKIQPRILEQLEIGKLDGLPAEVFVRGFIRSFARCVGLEEAEALQRYAQCAPAAAVQGPAATSVRAFVDSMSDLAPDTARGISKVLHGEPERTEVIVAAGSARDLPSAATFLVPTAGELIAEPASTIHTPATMVAAVDDAGPEASLAEGSVVEVLSAVATVAPARSSDSKHKNKRKRGKGRGKRASAERAMVPCGRPESSPTEIAPPDTTVIEAPETAAASASDLSDVSASPPSLAEASSPDTATTALACDAGEAAAVEVTERWAPKMPTVVSTTVSWRRPFSRSTPAASLIPSLVIDDADPESAERELEERAETIDAPRRSFLPPILLDREDRSARQGGLTLAVIILLIAATLTLSYLMRRPSSSGDGVTQTESTLLQQLA